MTKVLRMRVLSNPVLEVDAISVSSENTWLELPALARAHRFLLRVMHGDLGRDGLTGVTNLLDRDPPPEVEDGEPETVLPLSTDLDDLERFYLDTDTCGAD